MSDDRPSDVLGALPRRRPHRRSDKRAAPAPAENGATARAAASADTGSAAPKGAAASGKQTAASAKQALPSGKRSTARSRGATSKASTASTKPSRRKQPAAPASENRPAGGADRTLAPPTRATRRRPERLRQPAQPPGVPPAPAARRPEPTGGRHVLGTAAQAAAEIAEIGLTVSARALRNAVARLPRP